MYTNVAVSNIPGLLAILRFLSPTGQCGVDEAERRGQAAAARQPAPEAVC